jgi:predicted RNase H-like HicB family nuclease
MLVVVEQTHTGYSAFSPDIEGCVATGGTREEVEAAMQEAIEMHFELLKEQGEDVPPPHSYATYVEVAA